MICAHCKCVMEAGRSRCPGCGLPTIRIIERNKYGAAWDHSPGYKELDYDYTDFWTRAWLRLNDPCNG